MEWAKLHSGAKYKLALSGIPDQTPDVLGADWQEIALHGPNSYGYAPLCEAIAAAPLSDVENRRWLIQRCDSVGNILRQQGRPDDAIEQLALGEGRRQSAHSAEEQSAVTC